MYDQEQPTTWQSAQGENIVIVFFVVNPVKCWAGRSILLKNDWYQLT